MLAFLRDIDELVQNVKTSAQTDSLKARQFVNEACHLQDQALSMMSQVNRDLVKHCDQMAAENNGKGAGRKRRRVSFRPNDVDEMDIGSTSNSPQSENRNQRRSSLLNGNRRSDKAEREDDDEDEDEGAEEPMNIDDEADELEIVDEEEEDGMSVMIDRTKMKAMVNKLVKVTKGYNVQEMEEKMYHLLRTVYRYSNQWDKSEMMDELKSTIATYFRAKMDP